MRVCLRLLGCRLVVWVGLCLVRVCLVSLKLGLSDCSLP